ncbi:acyl carrier protein [Mollicutes bacterium LVI A0078]|nr:acyl carrier protein [Mollicutes bacterium LVI A0075]WOO91813.1 acyl carrier protein [Mollicutes bacterium LVI A0078]
MNTEQKVIEIIGDFLDIEVKEIKLESDLKEDLQADSLDFVELVMELEEEFDFEADEDKLAGLKTVGDVVKFIEDNK